MTLEDFFTLSEMKDGFSSTPRVEELMSSLLKQDNSAISNVVDLARQWSAVARVLVATEDKCCLVHFLELDGLVFLNQWLRDAVRYDTEATDDALQELISLLLKALQKLPVIMEKLSEIGVCETVKEVLNIENGDVREMAKVLLDLWKLSNDEDLGPGLCKVGGDKSMAEGDASSVHPILEVSSSNLAGGSNALEHAQKDSSHLSTEAHPDALEVDIGFSECYNQAGHASTSAEAHVVPSSVNPSVSCSVSNSCREEQSVVGDGSIYPDAVARPISPPNATGAYSDCKLDSLECKTFSEVPKEVEIVMNGNASQAATNSPSRSPAILRSSEECKLSDTDTDGSDTTTMLKPMPKTDIVVDSDAIMQTAKNSESHEEDLSCEKPVTEIFHKMKVSVSNDSDEESSDESSDDDNNSEVAGLSSMLDWKETDSRGTSLSKQADGLKADTRSEVKFDFGDDALEFALQVAIEVKHEVADREQCSSSSKTLESREDFNDKKAGKLLLDDVSSPNKNISEKLVDNEYRVVEQKEESPPSKGQELVETTRKRECIFDLNEVVCNEIAEDTDIPCFSGPNNLSAPIAVVAASRGPPILPGAPLHFKGELGWRGSAATSAFRPASPRRTPDKEKAMSVPKEKPNFLGIDLNFVEGEDEIKNDSAIDEPIPALPSVLSGDSSVQLSSTKGEKLKLDLNQLGDEDSLPSPSSSHRLSSSSACQHGARNIDLNDNPPASDASPLALNGYINDSKSQKRLKSEEPVITLMGSRFSIDKKEPNDPIHPAWAHGSGVGPLVPPSVPGVLTHVGLPSNGYSGPVIPPNQFLPSSFGPGSVPYVVDSRGAIVVPQLFGSSVESTGPYTSTLPFPGNLASSSYSSIADGTVRPSLNMDSGMCPLDSGSRELGSFRQFYMPGERSILSQEQLRASSPSAFGSGLTLKRKEPDHGWDCSPFGYKQGPTILGSKKKDMMLARF